MATVINVFIPGTHRSSGHLPVRVALRPAMPVHWQPGFVPVFERLAEPIDRPFWRRYDFIEAMPLEQALNYPVCGEA
jgi:hypothetical protein